MLEYIYADNLEHVLTIRCYAESSNCLGYIWYNRYAFVKRNLRRNTETSASLLEKDKSLLRSTSINAQHAPLLPQEIGPSNGLLGLGVNHQRRSRKTCT